MGTASAGRFARLSSVAVSAMRRRSEALGRSCDSFEAGTCQHSLRGLSTLQKVEGLYNFPRNFTASISMLHLFL